MIDENSNGLVFAHISHNVERIYLTGVISLLEGEVEVNLFNPDGWNCGLFKNNKCSNRITYK